MRGPSIPPQLQLLAAMLGICRRHPEFLGEVLFSNDLTNRISAEDEGLIEVRDFELPTLQAELDELAEKFKK